MLRPLDACRLYGFVDTAYFRGRDPVWLTRQLIEGGVDVIQLRAKGWETRRILALAERMAPLAADAGVWFVVNDHASVAERVGAPLCHLGQEDFFDAARSNVAEVLRPGSQLGVGLSSHAPCQAERAMAAGAAYLGVGPVFPTATKPTTPAVTLDYVKWASAHVCIPWFAIGGITLENLDTVLAAGATRICVVSAILGAPDIPRACQAFRDRLPSAPT